MIVRKVEKLQEQKNEAQESLTDLTSQVDELLDRIELTSRVTV